MVTVVPRFITLYYNIMKPINHPRQSAINIFVVCVITVVYLDASYCAEEIETLETVEVSETSTYEQDLTNGQPTTVLKGDNLTKKLSDTLGATLGQESGVSNASFGPGVGQPVVRGQGGPRVQILQDGLSILDASQSSGDHANAIEPMLAERIEVLKGPATLLYGGTAIGGAVNVTDNRVPMSVPTHGLTGAFSTRYSSVDNESSSVLKFDSGKDNLALHLDGFYRQNGNVSIPGYAIDQNAYMQESGGVPPSVNTYGYLGNTAGNAIGGTVGASYVDNWGYAGMSYNNRNDYYGIPPDGSSGGPQVNIFQTMNRSTWKNEIISPFELFSKLTFRLAYNAYQHVELENQVTNTTFSNNGVDSRLELEHDPIGELTGTLGFQTQNNYFNVVSAPGTLPSGAPALSPYSYIQNYALFDVEKWVHDSVTYQAGVRVEEQSISPQGEASRNFIPVSASVSALWQFEKEQNLRLAFSRSQRAPQVQELYFNGFHDATNSIEQGNANLNMETSYNLDLGYELKTDWMKTEISLFQNWFNNYIYRYNTGILANQDVYPYNQSCNPGNTNCALAPVYLYKQQNATFRGFEANVSFPLLASDHGNVDMELFGDYTRGQFLAGGNVPRMPPLRYGTQLGYKLDAFDTNIRVTRANAQNYAGDNDTTTPGYVLMNLTSQYRFTSSPGIEVLVFAKANNLLNETVRNSVSFLRVIAPQPGRGGELGIQINY